MVGGGAAAPPRTQGDGGPEIGGKKSRLSTPWDCGVALRAKGQDKLIHRQMNPSLTLTMRPHTARLQYLAQGMCGAHGLSQSSKGPGGDLFYHYSLDSRGENRGPESYND